jgi:hypothetical protein
VRYSRIFKLLAAARVPYDTTLMIDSDASTCAQAGAAALGVADYLEATGASVGVRLFAHMPKMYRTNACDDECASLSGGPAGAAERTRVHMACLARCANRHGLEWGCAANTASIVVRRGEGAVRLSRNWYARYMERLARQSSNASTQQMPLRAFLENSDQSVFGSWKVPRDRFGIECAGIANMPYNMHLGRPEASQGQTRMHGRPIVAHGCSSTLYGLTCEQLHRACCSRGAEGGADLCRVQFVPPGARLERGR